MELSKTLDLVRKLIERAEHPATPPAEAQACRERADDLMQKAGIEEWQAAQKSQTGLKPDKIKIDIGEAGSAFLTETATLVNIVSSFCNCSSVWMEGSGYGSRPEYCYVYGYQSDLRYFELLYTTLFLHMSGAIFPKPDPAKSLRVNVYEMHNDAGMNWLDIAQAYGWRETDRWTGEARYMYRNIETGERASWSKCIGRIKSAYAAEIKDRGEDPVRIAPGAAENLRRNACLGYLARLNQRLRALQGQRTGAELVLADKSQNIKALINEEHPGLHESKIKSRTFNGQAYARGTRHANTANLSPEATSAPQRPATTAETGRPAVGA